jgi:hypothetical protein
MNRRTATTVLVGILLSGAAAGAQQTVPAKVEFVVQPASPSTDISVLPLLISMAWPATVLVGLLVFRRPLASFLTGIGGRINKVSLGSMSLEIATAHQFTIPTIDQLRDPSWVGVGDSNVALQTHLTQPGPADYGVANLGTGDEWLTSRLFLLAALAERMRSSRYIVFVNIENGVANHFVGLASCRSLRFMLAMRSPWLESAFASAYSQAVDQGRWGTSTINSKGGALPPLLVTQIVGSFIQSVQTPAGGPNMITVPLSQGRHERAEWVTPEVLFDTLGTELRRDTVSLHNERNDTDRVKRLLKATGEMIAVVGVDGRFEKLVNRSELLDRVAQEVTSSI